MPEVSLFALIYVAYVVACVAKTWTLHAFGLVFRKELNDLLCGQDGGVVLARGPFRFGVSRKGGEDALARMRSCARSSAICSP